MLFSKLKISTKFIISSAVFLIPIGILLFFICSNAVGTINKSNEELKAITSLQSALKVMRDIPHYLDIYMDLVEKRGLKQLIEYIDKPDEQISELYDQIDELNSQINGLEDQINGLNDQINGLYGQIKGLYNQIDELNGQISGLDDQLSELYDQNKEFLLSGLNDQISDELGIMDEYLEEYRKKGNKLPDGNVLPNLPAAWKDLEKIDYNDRGVVQEYGNFANSLKDIIKWIGDYSRLILVSDTNTFYFVVSAFFNMPDAVMRTITIGDDVRINLLRWENLRERYNINALKSLEPEWFEEWVEKWKNNWMIREVLDEEQKEELWEKWVRNWKERARQYDNWWEILDEEWREELWEDWVEEWREEMREEFGEEWMEKWVKEMGKRAWEEWGEDYEEEVWEEVWEEYRAERLFEGYRDINFDMFDNYEFWQISEKLNVVEEDKDRIKTSLESAMREGNRGADNLGEAEENQIDIALESAIEEGNGRAGFLEDLTNRLRRYWDTFLGSVMGERNRTTNDFGKLANKLERYEASIDNLKDLYFSKSGYYYVPTYTSGVGFLVVISHLNTDLCDLWDEVFFNINEQVNRNHDAAVGQLIMSLGIVLVSLVIAFSFLIVINVDINKSVRSLKTLFKGLNENDLTMSLKANSKDEFGDLMTAFNGFLDILRSTVGSFKQSSQLVANSVFDLASSTKEITTTANEQSAGVSEIVSTMEGNKNLSEQISFKTTEVANLANETQDLSSKGAELREANQSMMEEIRNQNQKIISEIRNVSDMIIRISEAIRIIDGIADQTKLIAFNASLEASSSGEAGARFSVVASEIRRFADNVVESTKEIKQKIEEVQGASQSLITEANSGSRQIEIGYERMSEQKIVFEQIVDVSQNVATRSQQISNLSKQQELASSQIFTALKEISAGVKQFVAATSSTSKIADSLNGMSEELKEKVEKYRTET